MFVENSLAYTRSGDSFLDLSPTLTTIFSMDSILKDSEAYSPWSYSEVLTVASVVPALRFSHYRVIYPCNSSEMRDYLAGIWVITSLELALCILTHICSGPKSFQHKVAGAQ